MCLTTAAIAAVGGAIAWIRKCRRDRLAIQEAGLAEGEEKQPTPSLADMEGGRCWQFFKKYFLEGQELERNEAKPLAESSTGSDSYGSSSSFAERYRKYIAFLIPFFIMHTIWWTLAVRYDIFRLYPTRYEMPVTMILGATVAGMTSEGGGAVAFPVMTLLLNIAPAVARDFSLMIQSCGMTSAAFTIVWMRVVVEWHSITLCSLGSTVGIVVGFHYVDPLLTGSEKKMLFVAIWSSFALALFLLNRQRKRVTFEQIPRFNCFKGAILLATGFVGGICSAFAGSGVDICSFSVLTLLFRVSEKVATPTSVVLMAVNTCVGFFWRQLIMCDVTQLAWEYFQVSVPVVVVCAPFGAFLASHFHRLLLASLVYVLEILALLGFLATRPEWYLIAVGAGIIVFSLVFFTLLSYGGERMSREAILAREHHLKKRSTSPGDESTMARDTPILV